MPSSFYESCLQGIMVVCNVAESWACFIEGGSQRELGTKVISFPEPALLLGRTLLGKRDTLKNSPVLPHMLADSENSQESRKYTKEICTF